MYSQEKIMEAMRALGYKVNERGVCFGITQLKTRATITSKEQLAQHKERLHFIHNEPKLAVNIQNALQKSKNKNTLSEEDLKCLDVLSYFENIMLCQEPILASEWLNLPLGGQTDTPIKTSKLLTSPELETQGGIVEVYSDSNIYTELELSAYLNHIATKIGHLETCENISIQIHSDNHTMELTYNPNAGGEQSYWTLSDPNQILKEPVDFKDIAQEIIKAFGENNIVAFKTNIYANQKNAENTKLKNLLNDLHDIPEHAFTEKKATMKTDKNITLLSILLKNNELERVKKLLDKNPGLEVLELQNKQGYSPLHMAVIKGNADVVNILLKYKVNVNAQSNSKEKKTSLELAVELDYTDIAEMLLNDPNIIIKDNIQATNALVTAIELGNFKIKNILIEKGATIPMHTAVKTGNSEIVTVLLEENPNLIDFQDDDGNSPIMLALLNKDYEMVKFLLEKNPNLTIENDDDKIALTLAIEANNIGMISLFLKQMGELPTEEDSEDLAESSEDHEDDKQTQTLIFSRPLQPSSEKKSTSAPASPKK
jgi:ankyrin repeat protein